MSASPATATLTLSEEEIKVIGHALLVYRLELYDNSFDEEDDAEFVVAGQLLKQLGMDDSEQLASLDDAAPPLGALTDMDSAMAPGLGEEEFE